MNHYRVRARFRCSGFSLSMFAYFDANDSIQALKKGLEKFMKEEELPPSASLVFVSAFFLREVE